MPDRPEVKAFAALVEAMDAKDWREIARLRSVLSKLGYTVSARRTPPQAVKEDDGTLPFDRGA